LLILTVKLIVVKRKIFYVMLGRGKPSPWTPPLLKTAVFKASLFIVKDIEINWQLGSAQTCICNYAYGLLKI